MYKHNAESIKETDEKSFISKIEKDKFNNYPNIFINKEDVYTKSEFDNIVSDLDSVSEIHEDEYLSINNTSYGYLEDIEIFGNSVLEDGVIKSVGEEQEDGTFNLTLKSCGKNLFDKKKFIQDLTDISTQWFNLVNIDDRECIEIHNSNYFNKIKMGEKFKANTQYLIKWTSKFSRFVDDDNVSEPRNLYIASYYTDGTRTQTLTTKNTDTSFKEAVHISSYGKTVDYITISFGTGGVFFLIDLDSIQIEEYDGHTDNAVEPYQESEFTINLPCELNKIGDVSDRLFRRVDGVWCIEKKIGTIKLDGNTLLTSGMYDKNNFLAQAIQYDKNNITLSRENSKCITTFGNSLYSSSWANYVEEGVYIGYRALGFVISKDRFGSDTTDDKFSKILESLKPVIKHQYFVPEIIELSNDTQLLLNSFDNNTNIYLNNSPQNPSKIKVTVGKTLKTSTEAVIKQSVEISNRINNISNVYNKSKKKYSISKSNTTINSKSNGVIDNFKIKGDSMVNVLPYNGTLGLGCQDFITSTNDGLITGYISNKNYYVYDGENPWRGLNPNSTYTVKGYVKLTIPEGGYDSIQLFYRVIENNVAVTKLIKVYSSLTPKNNKIELNVSFKTPSNVNGEFGFYTRNEGQTTNVECKMMLLLGDHTNKEVGYFNGVMSVGDSVENSDTLTLISSSSKYTCDGNLSINITDITCEQDSYYKISSVVANEGVGIIDSIYLMNKIDGGIFYLFNNSKIIKTHIPQGVYVLVIVLKQGNSSITITKLTILYNRINGFEISTASDKGVIPLINSNFIDNEKYNTDGDSTISENVNFARYNETIPVNGINSLYIRNDNKFYRHTAMHTVCLDSAMKRITTIGDKCNTVIDFYPGTKYIRFYCNKTTPFNSISYEEFKETMIYKGDFDNKKIKYKNNNCKWENVVLHGLPNGICDTIEKHTDGKYYYHKRCNKIVFDGSEEWQERSDIGLVGNYRWFQYNLYGYNRRLGEVNYTNDRVYPYPQFNASASMQNYPLGTIGLSGDTKYNILSIKIDKSSLREFKQWLTENPLTFIYELAKEEIYECSNIDVKLFEGNTFVRSTSGPVVPSSIDFEISDSVGNIVNSLKSRLNNLENLIVENDDTHTRLLLYNRYMSDRTVLNLDINTVSNKICYDNNEDSELYDLILKNILKGIMNYDREYLENIIDFYTMIGYLSMEKSDRLFSIIEYQYTEYYSENIM